MSEPDLSERIARSEKQCPSLGPPPQDDRIAARFEHDLTIIRQAGSVQSPQDVERLSQQVWGLMKNEPASRFDVFASHMSEQQESKGFILAGVKVEKGADGQKHVAAIYFADPFKPGVLQSGSVKVTRDGISRLSNIRAEFTLMENPYGQFSGDDSQSRWTSKTRLCLAIESLNRTIEAYSKTTGQPKTLPGVAKEVEEARRNRR